MLEALASYSTFVAASSLQLVKVGEKYHAAASNSKTAMARALAQAGITAVIDRSWTKPDIILQGVQVFCSPTGDMTDVCLLDISIYLLHQASLKKVSLSHGEEQVPAQLLLAQVAKAAEAKAKTYKAAVEATKGKKGKKVQLKEPCVRFDDGGDLVVWRAMEKVAEKMGKVYLVSGEGKGIELARLVVTEVLARRVAHALALQRRIDAVPFKDVVREALAPLTQLLQLDGVVVREIQEMRHAHCWRARVHARQLGR